MLDTVKDFEEFVAPALLILLGGLFRVWQMQMKDRRDAARELVETKKREEEAKERQDRVAMELKRDTERAAREERDRLEKALEEERRDRRREVDSKLATYERDLDNFKKQAELDAREQRLQQRRIEELTSTLQARETEIQELKARARRLQDQIAELEAECEKLRVKLEQEAVKKPLSLM